MNVPVMALYLDIV